MIPEKDSELPDVKDEPEYELVDDEEPEGLDEEDEGEDGDEDFSATSALNDEELEDYLREHQPKGSKQFVRRLKKAHRNYHDERRAREEAEQMREEAVRYAQALTNELNGIRKRSSETEKAFVSEATQRIDAQLADAKARMKNAHEDGDTEAFVAASQEISRLTVQRAQADMYQPEEVEDVPEYQPDTQPKPANVPIDKKAVAWIQKNPWFNSPGHEDMTAYAVGVHNQMVNKGIDPVNDSDRYYRQLNDSLKETFPKRFAGEAQRKKSPVAGAGRGSGRAPSKVKITPTAERLAKRLGVPLEEYARHALMLEEQD